MIGQKMRHRPTMVTSNLPFDEWTETLVNIMKELLGKQNTRSFILTDFANDFGLDGLQERLLAVFPDAHRVSGQTGNVILERIKTIVGCDTITVNRKYKSFDDADLKTRVVMTCNQVPTFIDPSGALIKRMLIFRFIKSFEGKEDRMLYEKLLNELPGIVMWAIEGLRRLRKNEFNFSVSKEANAEALLLSIRQEPTKMFAQEHLEITGKNSDFIKLSELHRRGLVE